MLDRIATRTADTDHLDDRAARFCFKYFECHRVLLLLGLVAASMRNAQGQKRNCTNALGIARFSGRAACTRAFGSHVHAARVWISASRLRRLGTARAYKSYERTT